jgi:hypothetical protein
MPQLSFLIPKAPTYISLLSPMVEISPGIWGIQ